MVTAVPTGPELTERLEIVGLAACAPIVIVDATRTKIENLNMLLHRALLIDLVLRSSAILIREK
jgi:hypothetical protein